MAELGVAPGRFGDLRNWSSRLLELTFTLTVAMHRPTGLAAPQHVRRIAAAHQRHIVACSGLAVRRRGYSTCGWRVRGRSSETQRHDLLTSCLPAVCLVWHIGCIYCRRIYRSKQDPCHRGLLPLLSSSSACDPGRAGRVVVRETTHIARRVLGAPLELRGLPLAISDRVIT